MVCDKHTHSKAAAMTGVAPVALEARHDGGAGGGGGKRALASVHQKAGGNIATNYNSRQLYYKESKQAAML